MAVLKPRNRLVYFRVTEDEFQQLNHLCASTGTRSISDLARSAMRTLVRDDEHGHGDGVSDRLSLLETMVRGLDQKVAQLALMLGKEGLPGD